MAKRFVLVLVLMALVAGGVFANWPSTATWGGKKNFISGTLNLLGGGVSYERLLARKFGLGLNVYYSTFFIVISEFEAGLFGRFYIWNGLYTDLGLGFHQHWGKVAGSGSGLGFLGIAAWDIITGFGITPGLGFKFDPGKPGGFFVEPGIKVPITIGKSIYGDYDPWTDTYSTKTKVGVGVVAYVGLGWAF